VETDRQYQHGDERNSETMLQQGAGRLADSPLLPTSARAVLGYYAQSGVFDYGSLQLKRRVDGEVGGMIEEAFREVEAAIAESFGYGYVDFEYDTKLVLPAKLTLGHLYRELPETEHDRAEAMTRLAVEALLDGDMRDAINDDEFADFSVDFEADGDGRREIAEIAQEVLQARVEEQFTRFPDGVREAYEWGVERSERHQAEDPRFRSLMSRAQAGETGAFDAIQSEYKHASFGEQPALFTDEELALPYLKTQYDRVGVIYDAMVEMFRAADLPVEPAFHRSIVLAIVGAQIWLDDVDDYRADVAEGQLTPVTAEYLLAADDATAHENVVTIGQSYLDRARQQATVAESALTGIATEYIYHDGDPGSLPG
jgi:hypothetical protein